MERPEGNRAARNAAREQKTVKEKEGNYYVYLLLCSDGSYYCGYTDDPERRLAVHNAGKGAKYTRSRRPCRLVYTECFDTKHEAMRREYFLKKLSHREREQLAAGAKGAERGSAEHSL